MNLLRLFSHTPLRILFHNNICSDPKLRKNAFGIEFKNPVGLAAGFDKNAIWLKELAMLGFGSVEIGTVTPKPQTGNETPRLFRLPADKAIINRMGFNNYGAEVIANNLRKWRATSHQKEQSLIIGGNIGKNKDTANEEAWKDYLICFEMLHPYVDYFVVNLSSPNTPGLRDLQQKEEIKKILEPLQKKNKESKHPKPILIKIAPDLSTAQLDELAEAMMELHPDGMIISNTTISREGLKTPKKQINSIGPGGLSGAPLKEKALETLTRFHQKTGGTIPLVASGGIFTGTDAKIRLEAGASIIQVWTGFVYEGPFITKKICKELIS